MAHIIVGIDQSDTARRAADKAAELAGETSSTLHLLSCVHGTSETVGVGSDQVTIDPISDAETFLKGVAGQLAHDDIKIHASYDDPSDAMCNLAEQLDARMIVVGNRRVQGAARVLGSVATQVARQAPCDVLIANTRHE